MKRSFDDDDDATPLRKSTKAVSLSKTLSPFERAIAGTMSLMKNDTHRSQTHCSMHVDQQSPRKKIVFTIGDKQVVVHDDPKETPEAFFERRNRYITFETQGIDEKCTMIAYCSFLDKMVSFIGPPTHYWIPTKAGRSTHQRWVLQDTLQLVVTRQTCKECRNCTHPHWRLRCLCPVFKHYLLGSNNETESLRVLRRIVLRSRACADEAERALKASLPVYEV